MGQKFRNFARATLMGSIGTSDTSLTIEAAKADLFPVGDTTSWDTVSDWFKVTLQDAGGNREIVYVGMRTSGSGVFGNVLRAQEGTTALSFAAGSIAVHAITAADIEKVLSAHYEEDLQVDGLIVQSGVAGRTVPVGGIIMWDGLASEIDSGWQLCDGTNGTPDMRDKFVIGGWVDHEGQIKTNITGAPTKTGGSKDLIVPSHSHTATSTFTGSAMSAHTHGLNDPGHAHFWGTNNQTHNAAGNGNLGGQGSQVGAQSASAVTGITVQGASAGTPSGSVSTTVNSTGSSATNANLVPYYAVAFIRCMASA